MKPDAYRGIVAAVDRMVNRGDDADDVLRAVVDLLQTRVPTCTWAGISLVEGDGLVLGPSRGLLGSGSPLAVPIVYGDRRVGELALESSDPDDEDLHSLQRIALLISQHALVAWDTAGEAWNP